MSLMLRVTGKANLSTLFLWALVASAFFVEQLADLPRDMTVTWSAIAASGWMAWAFLLRNVAARGQLARTEAMRSAVSVIVVAAAFLAPLVVAGLSSLHPAREPSQGLPGSSPEGLILVVFRGVVTALVALGRTTGELCLIAAASLFLIVTSLIAVEHPAARAGLVAYAIFGICWLLATRRKRDHAGYIAAVGVTLVVAALGDPAAGITRAVIGLVPLSGGDRWYFPWATSGVGDGEDLVAARDKPTATGPVNSNVFVTSHKPSLYDLWTEIYGEPERPKDKKLRQTVSLAQNETIAPESHLPDSIDGGREFTTTRQGASRSRPKTDIPAQGLVTVTGPAPVHVRLAVFEEFDGLSWQAHSGNHTNITPPPSLESVGNSWMRWEGTKTNWEDSYHVTVGTLSTPALPLPSHASAIRIDRIERPDFFHQPHPGMLSLRASEVPSGTRIAVLSTAGGISADSVARPCHDAIPARGVRRQSPPWVAEIVRSWNLSSPSPSWDAAARVVTAMQRHCQLDPAAQAPPDTADTVKHFLCESRRGPDYCFAGAAVILLRELGFDARLASGFYLSGDRRAVRTRALVAQADHAHFWAEVQDSEGRWVPVEATPGYALRRPSIPWWSGLQQSLVTAYEAVVNRPVAAVSVVVATALGCMALLRYWRLFTDAVATMVWRLVVTRQGEPLSCTWRLLELRSWLAGRPRPRGTTPREWYVDQPELDSTVANVLTAFIECFEQVVYRGSRPPRGPDSTRNLSQELVRRVTCTALRQPQERSRPQLVGGQLRLRMKAIHS